MTKRKPSLSAEMAAILKQLPEWRRRLILDGTGKQLDLENQRMERAKSELLAMSDDEWEQLVKDANDDG